MRPYDPEADGPYAEWLKNKGVQALAQGWTEATRDQVTEGRTEDGGRFKRTRDQLGNDITERTDARGRQRKDVNINLR